MWVKFTSFVSSLDIDLSKIAHASDLNVVWCLNEVNSFKGAGWHDTGTVVVLRAVCYYIFLAVTNRISRGRGPETEIVKGVYDYTKILEVAEAAVV